MLTLRCRLEDAASALESAFASQTAVLMAPEAADESPAARPSFRMQHDSLVVKGDAILSQPLAQPLLISTSSLQLPLYPDLAIGLLYTSVLRFGGSSRVAHRVVACVCDA
jgi:hypothetical protein